MLFVAVFFILDSSGGKYILTCTTTCISQVDSILNHVKINGHLENNKKMSQYPIQMIPVDSQQRTLWKHWTLSKYKPKIDWQLKLICLKWKIILENSLNKANPSMILMTDILFTIVCNCTMLYIFWVLLFIITFVKYFLVYISYINKYFPSTNVLQYISPIDSTWMFLDIQILSWNAKALRHPPEALKL